jgi:hypothetical protein
MVMRFITLAGIAVIFSVVLLSPFKAAATQYVKITDPFVNVYEKLDPKSNVLKMVKKGDRLDLLYPGPIWYQVKVGDNIGWVERKAGTVVEGTSVLSTVLPIALIIVLLSGTIFGVSAYIKKQKTA